MSKIKINDKVIVKKTGKVGIVKGREVCNIADGRVKIEYVVKTGDGFENWLPFSRKELKKVVKTNVKKKPHSIVVNASDGYKVTLVAVVNNKIVWNDEFDDENECYFPFMTKRKDLSIGYAIYNPNDVYDPNLGIRIATHRAKTEPFCHLTSDFKGEFNKETINTLLAVKGEYIAKNIKQFINKR